MNTRTLYEIHRNTKWREASMSEANSIYVSPATLDDIKQLINESGLGPYWDVLKPYFEPGVFLTPELVDEDTISIGRSKIGGKPDVPSCFTWPYWRDTPMSFIAQINLNELPMTSINPNYPGEGLLYFFYVYDSDIWYEDDFEYDQYSNGRVFYVSNISILERANPPEELRDDQVFQSCNVSFNIELTIPDSDYIIENKLLNDDEEAIKQYWSQFKPTFRDKHSLGIGFRFLGHMDALQFGGYAESETLLFQADSYDEIGMEWDLSGLLYFFIEKKDFSNLFFEKVMTSRVGT
ncbi:YwqG family protein [Cohnella cholangitidis]|uniref:DUF1963 domain-containing protein n=1 Tax=Cohnella cholangitidis TaxID=2598458 RepID=A0A7G5BSY8_9BACL|nr:YwqG family protein [Cohnella cholangitidis]QMV40072.1 DUF1963 domain-containing protein [Cohnella cholangitidis]